MIYLNSAAKTQVAALGHSLLDQANTQTRTRAITVDGGGSVKSMELNRASFIRIRKRGHLLLLKVRVNELPQSKTYPCLVQQN